jgi:hypothetical protein
VVNSRRLWQRSSFRCRLWASDKDGQHSKQDLHA